jgi:hypothetical protein
VEYCLSFCPFFACILYPSSICGFWFDDFIRKQALQTINQIGMKSLEIRKETLIDKGGSLDMLRLPHRQEQIMDKDGQFCLQ